MEDRGLRGKRGVGYLLVSLALAAILLSFPSVVMKSPSAPNNSSISTVIALPDPRLKGPISLEETLAERRSIREYSSDSLRLDEVSQILWAGQGKTADWGGRTAPSAGGLYPLELYLVAGKVESLSPGVYKYNSDRHEISGVKDEDVREQLYNAALEQSSINEGPISLIITAIYARTTAKYGERGVRFAHLEAGHAAQNICLEAVALNLGAVTIGSFYDDRIKEILSLPDDETPLYIIPVGRKKS